MSGLHHFDRTILREYDIRGIVGKTLSAADARAVGQSFGTTVRRKGGKTVCVGYDVYRRPIYQTQYVQQAYQVWVPTRVYAPTYYRPPVTFGVGFGYRWR